MEGAFLSTLLPATGPAVAQLPALSQTCCESVEALASSAPSATPVVSVTSPGLTRPEPPASVGEQVMETLSACHAPSALPQLGAGAVLSILTVKVWPPSVLPELSVEKYVTVCS